MAAASLVFADRGYDNASIRAIAAGAGVDPALVHHYFGTKEQLFRATVQPPVDPAEFIPGITAGSVDGLGERIVTTFLSTFEDPIRRPAFEALLRGAFANKLSARLLREFFTVQIQRRLIAELGAAIDPAELPLRTSLVASQLLGLITTRYILGIEPLASTPREVVAAAIAPTLQRYLTGDLPRRS